MIIFCKFAYPYFGVRIDEVRREWTPKISGETRKASPLCIYG